MVSEEVEALGDSRQFPRGVALLLFRELERGDVAREDIEAEDFAFRAEMRGVGHLQEARIFLLAQRVLEFDLLARQHAFDPGADAGLVDRVAEDFAYAPVLHARVGEPMPLFVSPVAEAETLLPVDVGDERGDAVGHQQQPLVALPPRRFGAVGLAQQRTRRQRRRADQQQGRRKHHRYSVSRIQRDASPSV